jgi:polysaccharide export outer membrane protein
MIRIILIFALQKIYLNLNKSTIIENFNNMKKIISYVFLLLTLISCSTKRDILYFQDIKDKPETKVIYIQNNIQINDILSITVSAINPNSALPFNQSFYNVGTGTNSENSMNGYLVNTDGNISLPILGNIKVLGKTTIEVEDLIEKILIDQGQLTNPTVIARVTNAKITILGDISGPGVYPFSEQNVTLIQAIGRAGDLSMSGKRNDILIIREENGKRTYGHIDMRKTDWFNSEYYYIKQNDIIYVYPNGPKVHSAGYITSYGGLISAFFTGLSLYLLFTK